MKTQRVRFGGKPIAMGTCIVSAPATHGYPTDDGSGKPLRSLCGLGIAAVERGTFDRKFISCRACKAALEEEPPSSAGQLGLFAGGMK